MDTKSASEQEGGPQPDAGRDRAAAGSAAAPPVDALFDQLFQQLASESSAEPPSAVSGSVSQIFAPPVPAPAAASTPLPFAGSPTPRAAENPRREYPSLGSPRRQVLRKEAAAPEGCVGAAPSGAAAASAHLVRPSEPQAATPGESAGEFTRIFTQLPKPQSAAPAILAEAAATPEAAPVDAAPGANLEAAPSPPVDAAKPAAPHPGQPQTGTPLQSPKSQADLTQALPATTPAGPSAFSPAPQTFLAPPPTQAAAADVAFRAPSAQHTSQSPPGPGEFTRFFQALAPPESSAPAAVHPPESQTPLRTPSQAFGSEVRPAAPPAFAPADTAYRPQGDRQPAEASLASPVQKTSESQPGAFTAFFQAPAAGRPNPLSIPADEPRGGSPRSHDSNSQAPSVFRPAAPFAPMDPPAPAAFANPAPGRPQSGGFTELLHSLGNPPAQGVPLASTPAPAPSLQPGGFAPQPPEPSPFAPAAARAAPPGRGGEFTELLQSLQSPASAAPENLSNKPAANPPAPFFSAALSPDANAGPSEFTRILQGSAARGTEAPPAAFAPQGSSPAPAVGLPIAALPQLQKPAPPPAAAAARTRLQQLMPWLLAANGALLLLLIALAILYLRHHH